MDKETLQAKAKCFGVAQEVALTLAQCGGKQEMKVALKEMGFGYAPLRIEPSRLEWQAHHSDISVYISAFYGVVKVVNYKGGKCVEGAALLDERSMELLCALEYDMKKQG